MGLQYVSIPMAGQPSNGLESARMIEEIILAMDGNPVVPHDISAYEHDGPCPPGYATNQGHSAACWLRGDLVELLRCDGIVMGPGWEHSVGCRLELSVAAHCGIPIYYADLRDGTITDNSLNVINSF